MTTLQAQAFITRIRRVMFGINLEFTGGQYVAPSRNEPGMFKFTLTTKNQARDKAKIKLHFPKSNLLYRNSLKEDYLIGFIISETNIKLIFDE